MERKGLKKGYRWFLGGYTLLAGLLLAARCLMLYRAGTAPENMDGNGVLHSAVFSRENVGQSLRALAPWLYGYGAAVLAGLLLEAAFPEKKRFPRANAPMEPITPWRGQHFLTVLLYAAAAGLIAAGVLNGGLRDVLVKAINICTECIGLG